MVYIDWRLWHAKKAAKKFSVMRQERKVHTLSKSLKSVKNKRKYLQERAVDVTEIARTQEILRENIMEMGDSLNIKMSPKLVHLMHIVDHRELEKDLRNCASDVIKYSTLLLFFCSFCSF